MEREKAGVEKLKRRARLRHELANASGALVSQHCLTKLSVVSGKCAFAGMDRGV